MSASSQNTKTSAVDQRQGRVRVSRPNPHDPAGELKRFIGICADTRKQLDPENLKANVGRALGDFFGGLDEDSKKLVNDVAGMFRRPK